MTREAPSRGRQPRAGAGALRAGDIFDQRKGQAVFCAPFGGMGCARSADDRRLPAWHRAADRGLRRPDTIGRSQ